MADIRVLIVAYSLVIIMMVIYSLVIIIMAIYSLVIIIRVRPYTRLQGRY